MFSSEDLIFCYTRKEAVQDGILKDITLPGAEFGFKIPVAITAAAWTRCVAVPAGLEREQSERGRLSDLPFLASIAARNNKEKSTVFFLGFFKKSSSEEADVLESVWLKLIVHPGDHCEPVATILLEHED